MEDTEQFESKLTKISDIAFYSANKRFDERLHSLKIDELSIQDRLLYRRSILSGFKEAQKILVDEILIYQKKRINYKDRIREKQTLGDKSGVKDSQSKQKIIERRLFNLSHVADRIAVLMLDSQMHIARRLCLGERGKKELLHSNLKHSLEEANKINKSPDKFALIADITSFIQIGDLLVDDPSIGLYITELKEGKVNERIREFINLTERKHGIPCGKFQLDFSDKEQRQMDRMMRQDTRLRNIEKVVNEDHGIDEVTGLPLFIRTPATTPIYYDNRFVNMFKETREKGYSYRLIEDCIHIGMYEGELGLRMAPGAIPIILKNRVSNYILIDYMQITEVLSETIFAKPLPLEFLIRLMIGRARIILALEMDKLIEVFNNNGLASRWLTKRETAKAKYEFKSKGIVIINNRAIAIKVDGQTEGILSSGIINKILFDNILPSSLAKSIVTSYGPSPER
ncbi:hypothetical protein FXV77_20695 [Sphingobacterium phlebotomi]|uniref:Uncharacterized protein n=1 Tax=Sphingobacterium phlebotomi TaxID=2605433 RepID=A0A5D4GU67_9SPHI|nr:hypothetical protein [Sphingobacterium phlebotomi]TYR31664.1 hypothetical protein FXV77_20695 [Sphingobacterium phlebotomi]